MRRTSPHMRKAPQLSGVVRRGGSRWTGVFGGMTMHVRSSLAGLCALAALGAALLAGCQNPPGGGEADRPGEPRTATSSPGPARTSGYGAVFLAVDECSSFGRTSFTEVSCTRSEEHTSELQSRENLVCRLL